MFTVVRYRSFSRRSSVIGQQTGKANEWISPIQSAIHRCVCCITKRLTSCRSDGLKMKCMPHVHTYTVFVSLLFRFHDNKWISPKFNSIHLSARLVNSAPTKTGERRKEYIFFMIYLVALPLNCIRWIVCRLIDAHSCSHIFRSPLFQPIYSLWKQWLISSRTRTYTSITVNDTLIEKSLICAMARGQNDGK